jgi:trimeric autotransporter adhesin
LYNSRSGNNNIAIGNDAGSANTTGSNNIAIGNNADFNTGTLTNAIAIGNSALSTASNSMVLGSINGVNGATADTKVGIGVNAPSEKLEIGNGRLRFKGNVSGGNAHGITWTNNAGTTDRAFLGMETDDLFGIYNYGFGTWNVRVHNTSGEMGINKQPGTTAGESRLQIKQTGSTGALRAIGIETAINTNRWDIWVDNNAGPDFNFNYNGAIKGYIQNATGNYIVSSDRRLKKDIQPLAPALQNLLQLPVYTFRYNSNSASDPVSIGFMAQDVQKFYPNATPVKTGEKGEDRLGLNYQAITALSVKAIQEQQQLIQKQNQQIENLQIQIDELKKLVKKD